MLKKDILSISDLTSQQIYSILDLSSYLKNQIFTDGSNSKFLGNKILGMIFQKPSTRTRVSFETAMLQLGGNAINLSFNELQLSRGESIEDTAKTLSLYLDCLVARVYDHDDIIKLSINSKIPVINGLSNMFHPCQIIADLFTIFECKRKLQNLTVSFVGDGNNICNDLLLGCSKLGINIKVSTPPGFEPLNRVINIADEEAKKNKSFVLVTNNSKVAVEGSDIVITDTYVSIGKEDEKGKRESIFLPDYQINDDLVKYANKDYIFMHCLPATRGKEVTSSIIDGPHSVIWKEAENRLHVQKAILLELLSGKL